MSPSHAPWLEAGFFSNELEQVDVEVSRFVWREFVSHRDQLEQIAPKTFASRVAIQLLGSIVANFMVEGYPGRRYHAGEGNIDAIENRGRARPTGVRVPLR